MSGIPGLDGLPLIATIIAVILSAIASLLSTMTRKQIVEGGAVNAAILCELTGVRDPRDLQDIFGPPGMNHVWHGITLERIAAERRLPGYLISDDRVDWACIAVAVLAIFWHHPLADGLIVAAALVQISGWVLAYQLPRQA